MHIPTSASGAAANVLRRAAWELRRRARRVPGEYIPKTLLRPYLPPAPVVIDCGAYDGGDTREIADLWPDATIHAFEPSPQVFEKLTGNTRGLPNVHRHQIALSDHNGTATMHISSGGTDASSSLFAPKEHLTVAPHVLFQEECLVACQTLDDWAHHQSCPHVDLLWLDMQGGELAMLKAAPGSLSTVRVIHMEVALAELYEDNPLLPEVQSWLESQGFRRKLLALDCSNGGAAATGGNAVFVRR